MSVETNPETFESCSDCSLQGEISSGRWCEDIIRGNCAVYNLEHTGGDVVVVRTGERPVVNRDVAQPRQKLVLASTRVIPNPKYL